MGTDSEPATRWELAFPALASSAEAPIRELLRQAQIVRLPAQQPVFHAGSSCSHYLLVLAGSVRVHMVSESGREVTLYRVGPGDSCVLTTSCLMSHESYPAAAVTESEVTAALIPSALFEQAMDQSGAFRTFVFARLGQRLAQVIHRMEEVALGNIDRRLARYLLSRMDGEGVVRATHEAAAAELGTAREVVSRHLKRMESEARLQLSRGLIQIKDIDSLRRLAD